MSAKVTFKVTKGSLCGREFCYSEKEALILGRQDDCGIVIPENTVSRYHCMIEINPPDVTVRDFGSLNGTFLNEKKIVFRTEKYNPYPVSIKSKQILHN